MFFGEPFGGLVGGAQGAVLAVLLRTDTELTGRGIHSLVSGDHSLWSVQTALKRLRELGVVEVREAGRATLHSVNENHYAIPALRTLVDPLSVLRDIVSDVAGSDVKAVLLFGSVARGEATIASDIDLAVLAPSGWDQRTELEDAVRTRMGNRCDVLVFSPSAFDRLTRTGEPVAGEILRDGIALLGTKPRSRKASG